MTSSFSSSPVSSSSASSGQSVAYSASLFRGSGGVSSSSSSSSIVPRADSFVDPDGPGISLYARPIGAIPTFIKNLQDWRTTAGAVNQKALAILGKNSNECFDEGGYIWLDGDAAREEGITILRNFNQILDAPSKEEEINLVWTEQQQAISMIGTLDKTLRDLRNKLEPLCPPERLPPAYSTKTSWIVPLVASIFEWFASKVVTSPTPISPFEKAMDNLVRARVQTKASSSSAPTGEAVASPCQDESAQPSSEGSSSDAVPVVPLRGVVGLFDDPLPERSFSDVRGDGTLLRPPTLSTGGLASAAAACPVHEEEKE